MTAIPLGSGGEFDRIRAIARALDGAMGVIGDDTAIIPPGEGHLVISTDVSVEDVHFRTDWLKLEEIGWRATASALSDLAAAAAEPVGVVTAVVVPHGAGEHAVVELMTGVGAAAASVGAKVLGGDLSSGNGWSISVTVIGRAIQPMSRVGANAGDGLWVTGQLGGARAALEAWIAGGKPDAAARSVFARPEPRINAGRWLAAHGATAMMDLSDGVGGDSQHLASASAVRLEIELDRLPLHSSVAAAAARGHLSAAMFAAGGGEDYELLVTLPGNFAGAEDFHRDNAMPLTRIGTVATGSGVRATIDGNEQALSGFRHDI